MNILDTIGNLIDQTAFFGLSWGNYVMILVACVFLYLAIRKGYEPLLLVPIAFGMLLVNMYPDIMNSSVADFYGRRSHDRLWPADCQSKEFSSRSGSAVWYLLRIFSGNTYGI